MPKLTPLSAAALCKILTSHGFIRVRQSGSHIILRKPLPDGGTSTVVVPNHREIAKGTLKSIIEMSGLDENDFRK